jgi:hypothetical protein
MADRAWWMTALQWTVWFGLMSLVMGWLVRSRLRARPASNVRRLQYPLSTLIVGLVRWTLCGDCRCFEHLSQRHGAMVDDGDLRRLRALIDSDGEWILFATSRSFGGWTGL